MDDGIAVDFGEDGLVPAVAQDAETGEVLMLAYVSPEALERTRETGRAHYYSRSRDELWEKGATSGHVQDVEEIRVDCDADTILYLVDQEDGACHTGHRSCFYRTIEGENVGEQVFDPEAVYDDDHEERMRTARDGPHRTGDAVGTGGSTTDATPLEALEGARERFDRAQQRIEDRGTDTVETGADAYRSATTLLADYVDRATGTGQENFKAYVELEGQFATLVENLPDDLERRDAFEDALDAIDKRRLSESDFERARDALEPAAAFADLLDEREAAREELAAARTDAAKRRREIDDEIAAKERLVELGDADLEAPVERLREPIETYNEAIREAFEQYRREASVREVFALLERSRLYPFVEYDRSPEDLREYVKNSSDGEYTIPELLEYADYSRSKLEHYVADADRLKRRVATQRTFLDGIDAEPLTVDWPPGPAGVLRRRTREYRPFVERVADENVVAALRDVRALLNDPDIDYDRLQTATQAVAQLTDEERERLADGRVAAELEALREEKQALEDALAVDDPCKVAG